ncbi:hypothetical protein DVH05_014028 [Phytophthora capsici]|nr:hypothetical protein DVH05_014028 [Phytophthora capsici]
MALSTGDYALLHPEDVTTLHNEFQYAQVVSVRQSAVTLRAVGRQPAQLFSTARDVAESRKVPVDEATGSRPGIWMRKAVAFTLRGYTYYGQVVGYDGNELLVQTLSGRKRVPADQVSGEVYPVVALVMGARRWSSRMWPQDRLEEVHDKIVDSILAGNDGAPIASDLREQVPQELPMWWTGSWSGSSLRPAGRAQ